MHWWEKPYAINIYGFGLIQAAYNADGSVSCLRITAKR